MSRAGRLHKRERDLQRLEERFESQLRDELRACSDGHWGLFGQNDGLGNSLPAEATAARNLLELASNISDARRELGLSEPFALAERFKEYRAMRGPNTLGDPKLAKQFLEELDAGEVPQQPFTTR